MSEFITFIIVVSLIQAATSLVPQGVWHVLGIIFVYGLVLSLIVLVLLVAFLVLLLGLQGGAEYLKLLFDNIFANHGMT
jgi:hypothetical protein